MYCKNCGKQIENDSNFCMYCGTKVNNVSSENKKVDMPAVFESAVFIDSLFVKQSIEEVKSFHPNIKEEDISLSEIISHLIDYTDYNNYIIYYFEIQSNNMKPKINLDLIGKSVLIKDKPVKIQLVQAGFLATEMSKFFLENQSKYINTVIIADDNTYSDYLCKQGEFDNLTMFRRREGESRMQWGFYDKHGYFIDIIDAIYRTKK